MITGVKPAYYIAMPQPFIRGRGIASTTGPEKCFIQYKGVIPEREKLQRAAEIIGVSMSNMMRSVVNDFADAVIRDYEEAQREQGASDAILPAQDGPAS